MAWLVLLCSAVLEAVWATALSESEGLTRLVPSIVFAVATAVSMTGLAFAVRHIPLATAYAVWVGVGASLTAAWAMVSGAEGFSWPKLGFIAGIIACSSWLKTLGGQETGDPAAAQSHDFRADATPPRPDGHP